MMIVRTFWALASTISGADEMPSPVRATGLNALHLSNQEKAQLHSGTSER